MTAKPQLKASHSRDTSASKLTPGSDSVGSQTAAATPLPMSRANTDRPNALP